MRGPDPRALLQQGLLEHRAGRLDAAEQIYRAVLRIDRANADAHHLLASVHGARGQALEAIRSVKRALKLQPRRAAFHLTLGGQLFATGQFAPAVDAFRSAVELDPGQPGPLFNLALALDRAGRPDAAVERYHEAVALAPRDLRGRVNLGELLQRIGRPRDAVPVLEEATRLAPGEVAGWLNLASACRDLDDVDRALTCYARALAIAPDDPHVHMSHGRLLRELGRVDDAVAALRRAIAAAPDLPEPRLMLAMTTRCTARDADFAWVEALAQDPARLAALPVDRGAREHDVLFAYAKLLGDLGEPEREFEWTERANRACRQTYEYSVDDDVAAFARIRKVFDAERVAALAGRGAPDPTPIFVVGMPRSGTTLVEQILASHPAVHGAGEVGHLEAVLGELKGGFPRAFERIDDAALRAAGERYVARLRRGAPEAERIVDKLPLNFTRIGAIRAILPHAAIVHCVRDPRDTGLSLLRQDFERTVPYACDQVELGRYLRLYEELMAHWRAVLGPGAILDVAYEDVVADVDGAARRILAHCGLGHDPRCAEFHRTERVVKTASMLQVRQPVYRSSVGGWRRFEPHLGPLLAELGRG